MSHAAVIQQTAKKLIENFAACSSSVLKPFSATFIIRVYNSYSDIVKLISVPNFLNLSGTSWPAFAPNWTILFGSIKEVENQTVGVRHRAKGDLGAVAIDEFIGDSESVKWKSIFGP